MPAALVAARVLISQASTRKASKILKETWVVSPHPDLAELQAHLIPGDGPEARYDRVRDLLKEHKGGIEGAVALARAAAKAKHWDVAREALAPWLDDRPQARICALMADIEEASGDKGRAREWLARALTAPRDPIWVSDGVASPRWTPVSPVSGDIVPCEWKAPFEMPEQLEPDRRAGTCRRRSRACRPWSRRQNHSKPRKWWFPSARPTIPACRKTSIRHHPRRAGPRRPRAENSPPQRLRPPAKYPIPRAVNREPL